MARLGFLALALSVLALTGCSAGSGSEHRGKSTPPYEVLVKPAPANFSEPLPPGVCYVASRRYEVEISSRSQRRPSLCDRLAERYLPHEPRRGWPPPYVRSGNPDVAPTVVCVLAREAERVEIKYGPTASGRLDADSVCDALRQLGWTRRSSWDALDLP